MQLIDSHCHIDFTAFNDDRITILSHCRELGVTDIIVPGVSVVGWDTILGLCRENSMLHPALGLHPYFLKQHKSEHIEQLDEAIQHHQDSLVAVGEFGLDFYNGNHDYDIQIALVKQQLKLARDYDLPVILHVRKAHDLMLQLLKQHPVKGGVIHAFSGSQQQAQHYIKQGLALGIGGGCTYPRANRLRQLVSQIPLNALVLETDAPDMPLSGKQGQRNSPEYLVLIANTVSRLRGVSLEEIANTTTETTKRIFNI